jgi:hypothetical protein
MYIQRTCGRPGQLLFCLCACFRSLLIKHGSTPLHAVLPHEQEHEEAIAAHLPLNPPPCRLQVQVQLAHTVGRSLRALALILRFPAPDLGASPMDFRQHHNLVLCKCSLVLPSSLTSASVRRPGLSHDKDKDKQFLDTQTAACQAALCEHGLLPTMLDQRNLFMQEAEHNGRMAVLLATLPASHESAGVGPSAVQQLMDEWCANNGNEMETEMERKMCVVLHLGFARAEVEALHHNLNVWLMNLWASVAGFDRGQLR